MKEHDVTDPHDPLIADVAARAAAQFAEEADLGPAGPAYADGSRCHTRQRGDTFVMTIVHADGSRLVYELVGVNGDMLT
jgi:hypothetical protein